MGQGKGEKAVMTAVTAVLLHQCDMDTEAKSIVVIQGRGNCGYDCSYFITDSSQ